MSEVKERPILMCGEMVRAVMAGKKTETRRMAGLKEINKFPTLWRVKGTSADGILFELDDHLDKDVKVKNPYGNHGDILWVRETHSFSSTFDGSLVMAYKADMMAWRCHKITNEKIWMTCDENQPDKCWNWHPSIHMPRWASRITMRVVSVTLERLHEITDEGAQAEGTHDREDYKRIWIELNGPESWDLNPWVWVVKFDNVEVKK